MRVQIIRQLKQEMEALRSQLAKQSTVIGQDADANMQSQKMKLEEERAQFEKEKQKMLEAIRVCVLSMYEHSNLKMCRKRKTHC